MTKGSADQKQHLNLSPRAYAIVCQDMFTLMHTDSLSGFLNAVFARYYETAQASIGLYRSRRRQELVELFVERLGEKMAGEAADCLLEKELARLQAQVRAYPGGCMLKFRLNNENFAYLYPEQEEDGVFHFPEDAYYHSVGQYLKAVIEEYASHSFFEREEIFCRDILLQLENCIATGTLVRLNFVNGSFDMKPCCLQGDDKLEYHYLAGYSRPAHADGEGDSATSVRISQILSVETRSYRSGRPTAAQRKELARLIHANGIAFLRGQVEEEIIVRLTPEGVRKYRKLLHLRPALVKREEQDGCSIYHFRCTRLQARFYLFRLGADAYVLQPPELRAALHERFAAAAKAYEEDMDFLNGSESSEDFPS